MLYSDIIKLAVDYSDRDDLSAMMDPFLRVVEARVDKRLRTRKQYSRAVIKQVADQIYYGLPSDFADLRDIQTEDGSLEYVNPTRMNTLVSQDDSNASQVYTIIANQLQVWPVVDGRVMEVVYSARIPELTEKDPSNWLSLSAPDVYVFGLLVEISSYTRDGEAALIWEQRFNVELEEMSQADQRDRWSGPPLTIKTG